MSGRKLKTSLCIMYLQRKHWLEFSRVMHFNSWFSISPIIPILKKFKNHVFYFVSPSPAAVVGCHGFYVFVKCHLNVHAWQTAKMNVAQTSFIKLWSQLLRLRSMRTLFIWYNDTLTVCPRLRSVQSGHSFYVRSPRSPRIYWNRVYIWKVRVVWTKVDNVRGPAKLWPRNARM
jgi:hypothetical protein